MLQLILFLAAIWVVIIWLLWCNNFTGYLEDYEIIWWPITFTKYLVVTLYKAIRY